MARVSDVMTSDRDTSPDPITLPSSPIGARSAQSRNTARNSMKPSPRKTPRRSATPSKSMILDTPAGGESPWRIKVTVEAEPQERSPAKRITRTTTVPLPGSAGKGKRSSSPVKRAMAKKADGGEVKRPARKRKGTPIREKRERPPPQPQSPPKMRQPPRSQPQTQEQPELPHDMDVGPEPGTEEDDVMPPPSHSSARRASGRLARVSSQHDFAQSKRLSVAREELDLALQKAVGHSSPRMPPPGDRTVCMNEDFSIISVDSLKSAKEASFTRSQNGGEASAASVSYLPSSPPKARYPDLSKSAAKARSSLANEYDPMSWRPTDPAKRLSPPQAQTRPDIHRQSVEQQWERERESVSRQITNASPEDVVLVDENGDVDVDESDVDEQMDDQEGRHAQDEEDLWQGEASRSLEDEQAVNGSRRARPRPQQQQEEPQREERFEDLFAGQPLKPARSKIPRTWRRSSGMDFSYVDSPAHDLLAAQRQGDRDDQPDDPRHSADGGSGVLTPPSTDEDEEREMDVDAQENAEAQDDDLESEFQPDAEATRYQDHDQDMVDDFGQTEDDGAVTPDSDDSDADRDDTGNFFWNNLPQVFKTSRPRRRPERQKTMDLTELLGLDGSPAKAGTGPQPPNGDTPQMHEAGSSSQKRYTPASVHAGISNSKSNPIGQSRTKTLDSPLRKSLLKSSKIQDSSNATPTAGPSNAGFSSSAGHQTSHQIRRKVDSPQEDEGSNDTSQLLRRPPHRSHVHDSHGAADEANAKDHLEMQDGDDNGIDERSDYGAQSEEHRAGYDQRDGYDRYDEEDEEDYEDEAPAEPSQSYEERLNLDSPQKIKVRFNDSSSLLHPKREPQAEVSTSRGNSSLLAAKKQYPPLFGTSNNVSQQTVTEEDYESEIDSTEAITLVAKQPVRPQTLQRQPIQPGLFIRLSTTFWSAVVRPSGPPEIVPQQGPAVFPAARLAEVRHRYGVVSEEFPWDMCHMRTLHRMVNSLTSGSADSLVPSSGPLPTYLQLRVNTWQESITGFNVLFTKPFAYTIWTYMHILVPESTIEAMENGEIEWLGDRKAAQCREYYGKDTRHGSDPVWTRKEVQEYVDRLHGKIGMDFLVRVVGDVVRANKNLEEREGLPFVELQRLGRAGV